MPKGLKLKLAEKFLRQQALRDESFTCGTQLEEADIATYLEDVVFVPQLSCEDQCKGSIMLPTLSTCTFTVFYHLVPGVIERNTSLSARDVWTNVL